MSSQSDLILAALLRGERLTTLDIFKLCGSLAGHSRINDLRNAGHAITCKRVKRGGRSVWEYEYVGPVQKILFDDTLWALEESLSIRG